MHLGCINNNMYGLLFYLIIFNTQLHTKTLLSILQGVYSPFPLQNFFPLVDVLHIQGFDSQRYSTSFPVSLG